MKKIMLGAAAFSMVMGMASCSNEDLKTTVANEGKTVNMTVKLTKPGENSTRTSLEENNGSLDCKWSENDVVVITDANGVKKGYLTIIEGAGTDKATFKGEIAGLNDGENTVNFLYLGNGVNPRVENLFPYEYDYSEQSGEMSDFSAKDFLYSTNVKVNVADEDCYVEDMGLQRFISFAHLTVTANGASVEDGVKISAENLYNKVTLSATGEVTLAKGDINVTKSDMYIVVVPNTEVNEAFKFSATVDDVDYIGELPARTSGWKHSEFVRQANKMGIQVPLTADNSYDYKITYHSANLENYGLSDVTVDLKNFPSKVTYKVGENANTTVWTELIKDHELIGWSRTENGTENVKDTEISLDKNNITAEFWAIWDHISYEYELVFDGNKPKDSSSTVTGIPTVSSYSGKVTSHEFEIPSATMSCGNYEFLGWAESADATEATVGEKITVTRTTGEKKATKTLYAVWKQKNTSGGAPGAGGSGW